MNLVVCTSAAFLHYVFRLTAFVEPLKIQNNENSKSDSSASILPSTLVFLSICILLADAKLFSEYFVCRSPMPFRLFVEFLSAFILLEIGMILIWSRLEQLVTWLICASCCGDNYELYTDVGGDALVTMVLLCLSFALLVNTLVVTEIGIKMRSQFKPVWTDWPLRIFRRIRAAKSIGSKDQGGKSAAVLKGGGDGLEEVTKVTKLPNVIAEPQQKLTVKKKYVCLICEQRDCC